MSVFQGPTTLLFNFSVLRENFFTSQTRLTLATFNAALQILVDQKLNVRMCLSTLHTINSIILACNQNTIDLYWTFNQITDRSIKQMRCVGQSPAWEADSSSASQEIPDVVKPECSLLRSQQSPPVPILSQINPVHALTADSFNTYFNIIFPSKRKSSKRSLSLTFHHQNSVCISPRTTWPVIYCSLFHHPNNL
jgi:hypothetical protein